MREQVCPVCVCFCDTSDLDFYSRAQSETWGNYFPPVCLCMFIKWHWTMSKSHFEIFSACCHFDSCLFLFFLLLTYPHWTCADDAGCTTWLDQTEEWVCWFTRVATILATPSAHYFLRRKSENVENLFQQLPRSVPLSFPAKVLYKKLFHANEWKESGTYNW